MHRLSLRDRGPAIGLGQEIIAPAVLDQDDAGLGGAAVVDPVNGPRRDQMAVTGGEFDACRRARTAPMGGLPASPVSAYQRGLALL